MTNAPLSPQAALETLKGSVPLTTFKKYENQIHDPTQTLHWFDRLGSLHKAVQVQALPSDTPGFVAETLISKGEDASNPSILNPNSLRKVMCAGCGLEMHEFVFDTQLGKDYIYVSETQEVYSQGIGFIGDPAGAQEYWQADPDGSEILCTVCTHDGINGNRFRGGGRDGTYALRGFHPERNLMTQYSTCGESGTVISKEWEVNQKADSLNRTDSQGSDSIEWRDGSVIVPGHLTNFLQAYALDGTDRLETYLRKHNWTVISDNDIITASQRDDLNVNADCDNCEFTTRQYGKSKDERAVSELLKTWANHTEPQDGFAFPHLIDGASQILFPQEHESKLLVAFIEEAIDYRSQFL